jgi:hypothetical protein
MKTLRGMGVVVGALLVGVAGCADLDVPNINSPDAARALANPGDVESLIGGSFRTWWISQKSYESAGLALSVTAWEHSSSHGNMRMWRTSRVPREPIPVSTGEPEQQVINTPWYNPYRAIAASTDGLRALDAGLNMPVETGMTQAAVNARARAWGKFVQGLSHGSIALLYDRGFVMDETVDLAAAPPQLQPYGDVMNAALGYLDQAIQLAEANAFDIPETWVNGLNLTNVDVARLAHSYKARFMARVARTPAERQAANWGPASTPGTIMYHADRGVQQMFAPISNWNTWWDEIQAYGILANWAQMSYYHFGAADVSGRWQTEWINQPWGDRARFVMVTPDLRWPQGTTSTEQALAANRGVYFEYTALQPFQVARGLYYMSHYRDHRFTYYQAAGYTGAMTEFSPVELDLLKAEGHIYRNEIPQAVALINPTRVNIGGLPPLGADGQVPGGALCVPKRADGSCGNVMDAMKWEKRNELRFTGFAGFFYDDRGWGDLVPGTALHWPLPGREIETLQMDLYTFGGGTNPEWEANLMSGDALQSAGVRVEQQRQLHERYENAFRNRRALVSPN